MLEWNGKTVLRIERSDGIGRETREENERNEIC